MRNPPDPDAPRICAIRQKWYAHCIKKFDLIRLTEVVEWCASYPGPVVNDEARRAQARRDLLESMFAGEFGQLGKYALVLIPGVTHASTPARWPLRIWPRQIEAQSTLFADTWAPRGLCRRWLESRGIPIPWWLAQPVGPAAKPARRPAAPVEPVSGQPAVAKLRYPALFDAKIRAWADSLPEPPTQTECKAWAQKTEGKPTWGRNWHEDQAFRRRGEKPARNGGEMAV